MYESTLYDFENQFLIQFMGFSYAPEVQNIGKKSAHKNLAPAGRNISKPQNPSHQYCTPLGLWGSG
jgi:hypothetical protein